MPYLILIIMISGLCGGGYLYYQDTQARLEAAAANIATLKSLTETQEATIKQQIEDQEKNQELLSNLQTSMSENEEYLDDLRRKLNKHNLTLLALKRPAQIEKRINDGTAKVFKDIESDTAIPNN
jgi:chromosome segregation ATPase